MEIRGKDVGIGIRLFTILAIMLLSSISVVALMPISPSQFVIDVVSGEKTYFSMNITNNNNFIIYNLTSTLVQDFNFPVINSLNINETVVFNFSITSTSSYIKTEIPKIFFLEKSTINLPVENKIVNITSSSFSPNDIEIIVGSTITFINKDINTHSVTSSLFDSVLTFNQTFQYTFNNVLDISYSDVFNGFTGIIRVKNNTQDIYTLNPDNNVPYTLNINSKLVETNIDYILIKNFFNISIFEIKEGVIQLDNTGNAIAKNIVLDGMWLNFDSQNFNINPADTKFVTYKINPDIKYSNQTNKNYTILITLRGDNIKTQTKGIEVFIPFSNVFENGTLGNWWQERLKFCNAFPKAIDCLTAPIVEYVNITTVVEATTPYNFTQREVKDLMDNYLALQETQRQALNPVKEAIDNMNSKINTIEENVNKSTEIVEKTNKDVNMGRISLIVFGVLLLFGGGGFALFYALKKLLTTRRMQQTTRM